MGIPLDYNAMFPFNGNALDISGNGLNATLVGAPGYGAGKFAQGVSLDGATQYGTFPSGSFSGTDLTFTMWINSAATQNIFSGLVHTRDSSSVGIFFSGNAGNTLTADWNDNSFNLNTGLVVPNNVWSFIAGAFSATQWKLWVNGDSYTKVAANTARTLSTFSLGRDANNNGARRFNGMIDQFRYWKRTLSDVEIADVYAESSGGINSGLQAGGRLGGLVAGVRSGGRL